MHVSSRSGQVQGIADRAGGRRRGWRRASAPRRRASTVVQVPVADGGDGTLDAARRRRVRAGPGARRTGPPASRSTRRSRRATGSRWSRWPTSPGSRLLPPDRLDAADRELVRHRRGRSAPRWTTAAAASCWASAAARAPTAARACWQALGARLLDAAGSELRPRRRRAGRPGPRSTSSGLHPALAETRGGRGERRRQPAARPARRRRGVRAAEGRVAGRRGGAGRRAGALGGRGRRRADRAARTSATARAPGAAGGVGFAAMAVLGAELAAGHRAGARPRRVRRPPARARRLVVTGEGSLDEQTLTARPPPAWRRRPRRPASRSSRSRGRLALTADQLAGAGIRRAYALTDIEPDPSAASPRRARCCETLARTLARDWLKEDTMTMHRAALRQRRRHARRPRAPHHRGHAVPRRGPHRPRYRFFSVRDEFPALWPVAEGGVSVEGELYDVPLDVIRDGSSPPSRPSWSSAWSSWTTAAARSS